MLQILILVFHFSQEDLKEAQRMNDGIVVLRALWKGQNFPFG